MQRTRTSWGWVFGVLIIGLVCATLLLVGASRGKGEKSDPPPTATATVTPIPTATATVISATAAPDQAGCQEWSERFTPGDKVELVSEEAGVFVIENQTRETRFKAADPYSSLADNESFLWVRAYFEGTIKIGGSEIPTRMTGPAESGMVGKVSGHSICIRDDPHALLDIQVDKPLDIFPVTPVPKKDGGGLTV